MELETFDIAGKNIYSFGAGTVDFVKIFRCAEDLCEVAKTVVIGEVLEVFYSDKNAVAMTCYDFKISDSLRGDLGVNDIITVVENGGYIRGDVYDSIYGSVHFEKTLTADDLIASSFCGTPMPEVGDKYILFLGDTRYMEGTYSPYGAFMGKYYIDGESVYRATPPSEPWYYIPQGESKDHDQKTVSEVIEAVEKTPAIIDDTYRMFNIE
ncbi:MAG: hypothetical protein HUJ65_07050 [Oscillospiraceae bacterium]|nr:hypothetical protein [Oscillospiraceae bacterium]